MEFGQQWKWNSNFGPLITLVLIQCDCELINHKNYHIFLDFFSKKLSQIFQVLFFKNENSNQAEIFQTVLTHFFMKETQKFKNYFINGQDNRKFKIFRCLK